MIDLCLIERFVFLSVNAFYSIMHYLTTQNKDMEVQVSESTVNARDLKTHFTECKPFVPLAKGNSKNHKNNKNKYNTKKIVLNEQHVEFMCTRFLVSPPHSAGFAVLAPNSDGNQSLTTDRNQFLFAFPSVSDDMQVDAEVESDSMDESEAMDVDPDSIQVESDSMDESEAMDVDSDSIQVESDSMDESEAMDVDPDALDDDSDEMDVDSDEMEVDSVAIDDDSDDMDVDSDDMEVD